MLPALGMMAAGGALNAGVKGVQNLVEGEEREKAAKRQALQALSQKFQASTGGQTFSPAPEIPKAPGFGEAVVAPMAQAAVGGAMNAGIGAMSTPSKAVGAAPTDPHSAYQQDFGSKMAPAPARPAAMPGMAEQDFYTSEAAREEARRMLGGR